MQPPPHNSKPDPVSPKHETEELVPEPGTELYEEHCTICLQAFVDRTLVPTCSHEFCFDCLMIWCGTYPLKNIHTAQLALISFVDQSRRCPLCSQDVGDHLIHRIRSTFDYQKHFLPPLRTSPRPLSRTGGTRIAPVRRRRTRVWGPRDHTAQDEADALERAVSRRRWIYQHDLYAKVN
jgi:Zinc finger, C3HC4 type (RING finger)